MTVALSRFMRIAKGLFAVNFSAGRRSRLGRGGVRRLVNLPRCMGLRGRGLPLGPALTVRCGVKADAKKQGHPDEHNPDHQ